MPTDYKKLHSILSANNLVKSAMKMISKLTGNEDFINWLDQLIAALKYYGISKILTGEWTLPTVDPSDVNSAKCWRMETP